MKQLLCALVLLGALPAQADDQYWDYGDWTVYVESYDTGEDWRVNCRASTGGDGGPSLSISLSNGDASPPHYYPQPTLYEHAPRGHTTFMRDGARVLFEFDMDWRTEGFVTAGYDNEGFAEAAARAHQGDSLSILRTMRHAGTMWVTMDGEIVYEASLSGFTAAYGKMAEQCGFSTVGVIE